jgi:hypothetical protein
VNQSFSPDLPSMIWIGGISLAFVAALFNLSFNKQAILGVLLIILGVYQIVEAASTFTANQYAKPAFHAVPFIINDIRRDIAALHFENEHGTEFRKALNREMSNVNGNVFLLGNSTPAPIQQKIDYINQEVEGKYSNQVGLSNIDSEEDYQNRWYNAEFIFETSPMPRAQLAFISILLGCLILKLALLQRQLLNFESRFRGLATN